MITAARDNLAEASFEFHLIGIANKLLADKITALTLIGDKVHSGEPGDAEFLKRFSFLFVIQT